MVSGGKPPQASKSRVIAYIDGFNLYYGLKNSCRMSDREHLRFGGHPAECIGRSLYWLDVAGMIRALVLNKEELVAIKYFSAPRRVPRLVEVTDEYRARCIASNDRQSVFLDAIRTLPKMDVILGWYTEKTPVECRECGHRRPDFEEKQTDVSIATHMICDAYENRCDLALVMSGDADLTPAFEAVKMVGKRVRLILPPGRKKADMLRAVATQTVNVKIHTLRKTPLPDVIHRQPGLPPLTRPEHWKGGKWVWGGEVPQAQTKADRIAGDGTAEPTPK